MIDKNDLGYPIKDTSVIVLKAIKVWMDRQENQPEENTTLKDIRLCIKNEKAYKQVKEKFTELLDQW